MNEMTIYQILERLPHRYPMILVDRVLSMELGKEVHALKNVTANEPFFHGHYPEQPIMPGVLIVESLAQAAALLVIEELGVRPGEGFIPLFAGIDKVRFKSMVIPGDQLNLHVEIVRAKKFLWKMHAVAKVNDEVACTAELTTVIKELTE